ncbi:MAG TPA: hypothetical protein VGB66_15180 [Longimicrobium sp.]|jgi:hypothetical protein
MRKILALTLALFLVGCERGGTGPEDGLTGRYKLLTASGVSIPGVVGDNGSYRWEILAGEVRIARDSSYVFTLDNRETAGNTVQVTQIQEKGFVRPGGGNLEFRAQDDGRLRMKGSLSGDTLTLLTGFGPDFVFRRN